MMFAYANDVGFANDDASAHDVANANGSNYSSFKNSMGSMGTSLQRTLKWT